MSKLHRLVLWTAAALALAAGPAQAAYPDKPITMVVAYGAGGSTDLIGRMLAPYIEKNLGGDARIVVMNRPGAGGEIGFSALADAAPDGYTIGFINTPNFLTIPVERQARYRPDQLDPLVNIVDDPGVMAVRGDGTIKTLADLAAYAKDHPAAVTVGSTGVGSDDHLAMLMFQRQAKVMLTHVPFGSDADNTRSMLGGHTTVAAMNLGEVLRAQQGEPVVALGLMATARAPEAPELKTATEQGFAIISSSLRGIAAPKGLPADIRAKLADAVLKAAEDPEFQAKARAAFMPLRILKSEDYAAELAKGETLYRALWAEMPWSNK